MDGSMSDDAGREEQTEYNRALRGPRRPLLGGGWETGFVPPSFDSDYHLGTSDS